ncbi:MAG: GTPase HflX, partial [Candidatus Dormibacteraeota bacterium]|nr:GTPase HflX [Candidatus Dormibacteraeota bacterium]
GKLQVELARLQYLSTRLVRRWSHLERQRGGIGNRGGPGEAQIELDRRMIGERLKGIKKQLEKVKRQRHTQRRARERNETFRISLVGYTNAGKSTLLNRLTNSTVLADNLLFATLDPTSRLLGLSSGRRVIVTDTVGFIQSLPHELVEAFSATLEEVREAHLLTVVVDASHPDAEGQLETVLETLDEMGCNQPAILAVNKIDRLDSAEANEVAQRLGAIAGMEPVLISAAKGTGLRDLRTAIDELVAHVVPDTRANRPIIAAHAVEEPVPELDETPVRAARRAAS